MRKIRNLLMRYTVAVDIAEAFCAASALFYLYFSGKTNYLATLLLMICFTLLFHRLRDDGNRDARRGHVIALTVSAILAVAIVVTNGTRFAWGFADGYEAYRFFMSIAGLFLLYFRILRHLYARLLSSADAQQAPVRGREKRGRRTLLVCAAICFLCYIPYFLADYPAVFSADSVWQIHQALGVTAYSNHHPLVHTLILKLFLNAGRSLFGSLNAGLAMYTLLQMLFLSTAFAYTVWCIEEMGAPTWLRNAILLFYTLFPLHAFYSITVWKDIPFGVFALLFTISLWRLTRLRDQIRIPLRYWLSCFVFGLCFCIFRSNGLYAFLVCIPFLVATFRRHWRHAVPTVGAILLSVGIYQVMVTGILHATPAALTESLSIPIQQIARVLKYNGDLTDEQPRLLNAVANTANIPALYNEHLSDPIKWYINDEGNQQQIAEHPLTYLKLWIEIGLQNPSIYLDAYIAQTQGYWNPNVIYWTNQWEDFPNDVGLHSDSPLSDSAKDAILYSFPAVVRQLPAIGILWSPAFYTGMLVILLGAALLRKRPILPFAPCFAVLLTVLISTPVHAEFRYIYALVATMPLLLGIACCDVFKGAATSGGNPPADPAQTGGPART